MDIILNLDTQVGSDPRTIPPMRQDIQTLRDLISDLYKKMDEIQKTEGKIGLIADTLSDIEDRVDALENPPVVATTLPFNPAPLGVSDEFPDVERYEVEMETPTQRFSWNWLNRLFKWK